MRGADYPVKCPCCGAPVKPTPPDGDIKHNPKG